MRHQKQSVIASAAARIITPIKNLRSRLSKRTPEDPSHLDDEIGKLKRAVIANGRRARWSARAIVGGLVFEVIVLLWFSKDRTWLETGSLIFANVIIALGVWLEDHFAHQSETASTDLQRISDEKIAELGLQTAEANQRAAEAQWALAAFRFPRKLNVGNKTAQITARLKPYAGTEFDTGLANDDEAADLLWLLEPAMTAAGWNHIPWVPSIPTQVLQRGPLKPDAGLVAVSNVSIQVHPGNEPKFRMAAEALIDALRDLGIAAQMDPFNIHNANTDAMHVMIGPKR